MKKPLLLNQVAIVTGASSGIGRLTALALARQGARVVLASRRLEALKSLAAEINSSGGEAIVVPTDVVQRAQIDHLVETTMQHWGCVDILVSNAGQYIRSPIYCMNHHEMEQSMAVNFFAAVYAVQAVLPNMLARSSGHIVLVSSQDGLFALPGDAPYVSAKHALNGFGATLRQELAGKGISVSIIIPGRIDTPMIEDLHLPWISPKIPPEIVARKIVQAIQRRQAEVTFPFSGRLLHLISILSPRLSDWFIRLFHLQGWNV